MSIAGDDFQMFPWSDRGGKHLPDPSRPWPDVVAGTGRGRNPTAKYHPSLTRAAIEEIEICCLAGEVEILLPPRPNIRNFWREFADRDDPIGASTGEETRFLMVRYDPIGTVHGRPITRDELRRKGADL